MDMNDFQEQAVKTLALTEKDLAALSHRSFGLAGETGHVVQIVKKIIRDKQGEADASNKEDLKKRLGDVMYYVAALADYYDLDLNEIARNNIEQSKNFKKARNNQK
jgi:NTP pyrophosphatase (non-canonical NTP hydrolase)